MPRKSEERRGPLVLSEKEHDAALRLVDDLERRIRASHRVGGGAAPQPASRLAEAHAAVAEALARDAAGSPSALWQGEAGEALSVLLAELIEAGRAVTLEAAEYPAFYRSLVAGEVVRPRFGLHPRLFIWGPLEARLQQPDLVILGSLNEGVWPRPEEAGPWLNRPMRASLGLAPPERRIGLSAHDFAQGARRKRGLSHPRAQSGWRADRAVALAAAAARMWSRRPASRPSSRPPSAGSRGRASATPRRHSIR